MNLMHQLWLWLVKPAALIEWLGDGAKPVGQAEAERRALICVNCPANHRPSSFTAVLGNGVEAYVRLKNRMRLKTAQDEHLNTCAVCFCKLTVKVWTPYEYIKQYQPQAETEKLRAANRDCWQI